MPLPDADSLAEEFLRETQRPDLSIIEKHATEIIDRARAVDARINATEGREVQRIQLGCDEQRRAEARAVFPYKDQPNALNIDALPASEINRLAQLDQLAQLKDLVKRHGPSKMPSIRGSRRFMPVFQTPTGKFAVPAYTVGEGSNQFKFTWDMESQQIYVMKNARVAANSTEIVDETLGLDSSKTSYWEGELVYPTEAQWAEINKLFGRPMQQTFFDYVPTDRNSRFLAKVFLVTYGGGPAGLAAEEALKKGASGMKAFAILSAKALVDVAEGHAFIFFGAALFRLAGKFAGWLLAPAWRYALGPITKVLAKAISRVFGRIFSKTKGKLKELIGEASRKLKDYLKRWGKKADDVDETGKGKGGGGTAKSPGDLFEESAKKTFRKKIIRENEVLRDSTGKVTGEIDFETAEAIVEVGISLKGKAGQLHRLAEIARQRAKRLDVIYGPNTSSGTLKFLRESLRKKWGNRVRFIPHE